MTIREIGNTVASIAKFVVPFGAGLVTDGIMKPVIDKLPRNQQMLARIGAWAIGGWIGKQATDYAVQEIQDTVTFTETCISVVNDIRKMKDAQKEDTANV